MGTKHQRPTLVFLEIAADWADGNGVPVHFTRTKDTWIAHFTRGQAVASVVEMFPQPKRKVIASKTKDGKRIMRERPAENITDYQHRMYEKFETAVDEAVAEVHNKWKKERRPTSLIYTEKEPEFHVA